MIFHYMCVVLGYNLYTEGGLWTPASAHTETPTIESVYTTNGFVGASIRFCWGIYPT